MKVRLLLTASLLTASVFSQTPSSRSDRWFTTWAAGPEMPYAGASWLENQTVREIMHVSVGGNAVRVRISNQFGRWPLEIADAHVALRSADAATAPGSDHALTFGSAKSVTIPAGAVWLSDPVAMDVPALSDVAVSLYFAKPTPVLTQHTGALQTNYLSPGDVSGAATLPAEARTLSSYPFVTGIEVIDPKAKGTVVALGDSITDGFNSHQDTNHRWPNLLAERLQQGRRELGVANVGISANRILHDGPPNAFYASGPNAVARFDSDVLAQTGVTYVIVLEGVNDLGHPGQSVPSTEDVSPEQVIAALQQMALRAHTHNIKIFVGTIMPFEGTLNPGYYSPAKEQKRQRINEFIRASRDFDAVIDFDQALRDPAHPTRLNPPYDSGDHLHPSDAGQKAIADAIDLSLFER
jgi:lysophospholipase L1-like esterase